MPGQKGHDFSHFVLLPRLKCADVEQFVQLAKETLDLLFQHARKEDEEVMPWLAEKGIMDLTSDSDSTATSK